MNGMEGLLVLVAALLGELLLVPLIGAIVLLLEVGGLTVGGVLEVVGWRRRRATPTTPRIGGRVRRFALVAIVIPLTGLLLAQFLMFEPLVRWAVSRQDAVTIDFRSAHGNLFTGHVVLDGVTIVRDDPENGSIDLAIGRLDVDVALLGALSSTMPIDRLSLAGITGSYARDLDLRAPRRAFAAEVLELTDVDVLVVLERGERRFEFQLAIDDWRSEPFRSRHAVFDALVRSNGSGRLATRPFSVTSRAVDRDGASGRETEWLVDALPLPVLAGWFGGPMSVLTGGTANIAVRDRWVLGNANHIHSQWDVVLHDVAAEVPDGLGRVSSLVARPLVLWLAAQDDEIPLSFSFELDEGEFTWDATSGTKGLWGSAARGLMRALAEKAGIEPGKLAEATAKGAEWVQGWWRRRRGK